MEYAKLINEYLDKSFTFIEKWNKAHYNIVGFDQAYKDLEFIFKILFYIENYDVIKKNNKKLIYEIIDKDKVVSLSLKSYERYYHRKVELKETLKVIASKLKFNNDYLYSLNDYMDNYIEENYDYITLYDNHINQNYKYFGNGRFYPSSIY